jgi:hypothetical protein
LDERAVRQYRRRLAVLEAVIDRCDARGDRDGAVQAHAERDWLLAELRSAAGLAGRTRSFATTAELARVSVSKALRRALRHVTAADPVVGATLSSSIRTGSWCVYRPYGEESEH